MPTLDPVLLGQPGSFSPAIKYNGLIFCSGFIGIDLASMKLVEGTTKDRTVQALKIIDMVLQKAGSSLRNVIKVNVYLTKRENYELMNEAYDDIIHWEPKPARTSVFVQSLPYDADVEIEVVAAQGD